MVETVFVILGSKRTGSNLLVSKLDSVDGITCHGEIYNPYFVGISEAYYESTGFDSDSMEKRDTDLDNFLATLCYGCSDPIMGFKFFPTHGDETHQSLLHDCQVKKIFLRRNILHSFVSLRIAEKSDVWQIGYTKDKQLLNKMLNKSKIKIVFEPYRFESFSNELETFWNLNLAATKDSRITYIDINYSQLNDDKVFYKLLKYLGANSDYCMRDSFPVGTTIKQTSSELRDKVENYDNMVQYIYDAGLEHLLS